MTDNLESIGAIFLLTFFFSVIGFLMYQDNNHKYEIEMARIKSGCIEEGK